MFLRPLSMIRSFVALAPLLVILGGLVSGPALSQNKTHSKHGGSGPQAGQSPMDGRETQRAVHPRLGGVQEDMAVLLFER